MIQEAEGYATARVNRAEGDVAGFKAVLEAYKRSPEVTRRRIYLETMAELLPTIDRKVVIGDDLKSLLPLQNPSQMMAVFGTCFIATRAMKTKCAITWSNVLIRWA